MPTLQHLLETRFSVRLDGAPLERAWIMERVDLLQRLTLPAVAAQTTDAFTWVLLCDESTDPDALEQLRAHERQLPCLRIGLTTQQRTPLSVMRSIVREDVDVLITTRLDSDDLIADAYLEAVQGYAESFHRSRHEELLLNFPHGRWLDAHSGRVFPGWLPNGPFHSFFERPRRARPKTVMREGHGNLPQRYADYQLRVQEGDGTGWHVQLHQHYPTHQDESMVAWMLGVHGGNVSNRIPAAARESPASTWPEGFTHVHPQR